VASVALILVQIAPVIPKLSPISTYSALVALANVVADLTVILADVGAVRANLSGVLTEIAAFNARTIMVAAPVGCVAGAGLRSGGSGARQRQRDKSSHCFSVHTISQLQVSIDHRRVVRAVAGIDEMC